MKKTKDELIQLILAKLPEVGFGAKTDPKTEEDFDAAKIEIVDDLGLDKNDLKILNDITYEEVEQAMDFARSKTKITESELKKIIKEETEQVLSEFEERKLVFDKNLFNKMVQLQTELNNLMNKARKEGMSLEELDKTPEAQKLIAKLGLIHNLINNKGIRPDGPLPEE